MRRFFPQLRALFVAFHLVAIVLMAIPAPSGGMQRSTWADPTVQTEFGFWARRMTSWGYSINAKELEQRLWDFAVRYMDIRKRVLAPVSPYIDYTGSTQSWRMFVAPHRFPARLEISVREDMKWKLVYRERDPDATWLGRKLDHDRFRSAIFRFAWKPYRRYYEQFTEWTARHAAVDFPEADQVRILFTTRRTPDPEEVREHREPTPEPTLVRTLNLADYR